MDNIFALIVLMCQKALDEGEEPDEKLGKGRLTIARALPGHNYEHARISNFLVFLKTFYYTASYLVKRRNFHRFTLIEMRINLDHWCKHFLQFLFQLNYLKILQKRFNIITVWITKIPYHH